MKILHFAQGKEFSAINLGKCERFYNGEWNWRLYTEKDTMAAITRDSKKGEKSYVFTSCFDGINQIIDKDNSITRVILFIFLISSV